MVREIINIDENLCNGCGECVPNCHEGALQVIDGKVRLVSDLMCDGLGACIGYCPENAITIEKREAAPYNETKVMEDMVSKGKNVIIAHLKHLKDHGEIGFLKEGVQYLKENEDKLDFTLQEITSAVHNSKQGHDHQEGGCPGSKIVSFDEDQKMQSNDASENVEVQSELKQWPIQMHLISPMANYFTNSDLVLAADCVPFSVGNFHQKFLKGKSLAIACPKLDSNMEVYISKLESLIDDAKVNIINVIMMEVPCCGGMLQMAQTALANTARKVPIKATYISLRGDVISEEWV